jgi:hypothetical protein
MKRLFYLIALLPLMVACTNENDEENFVFNRNNNQTNTVVANKLPSTEVFVQGSLVNYNSTRREFVMDADEGYGAGKWPHIDAAEGWEAAKFTIRIDESFPGVKNQAVIQYWSKKTKSDPQNLGKVYTDFPWGRYNDRDYDYYKIDQKGPNTGMFRYVLDPSGYRVKQAIKEEPNMKAYLTWLKDHGAAEKEALTNILNNWDNYKIVWYVAKEVGGNYLWHVNGIFVEKDKTPEDIWEKIKDDVDGDMDISDENVANNVEIDIHKQEHEDWNEIKTSVHIRADVENVQIKIPIEYSNIVEADDFSIRIYNKYISGVEIKNMIVHDENEGIIISIDNIDPALINMLKDKYGDGLTVEIHSYCKEEDGIWEAMKKTKISLGKASLLKYQITSADATENGSKIVKESTEPVTSGDF